MTVDRQRRPGDAPSSPPADNAPAATGTPAAALQPWEVAGVPHPGASSTGVARRMSRQARRDTAQEVEVRRLLHAAGLRYRVALPVEARRRRTIDVAFTRQKIAVFLDGCFWHGCPAHGTSPKANSAWWADKLRANRTRDLDTDAHLRSKGWLVLRFWEHENSVEIAAAVTAAVHERGGIAPRS